MRRKESWGKTAFALVAVVSALAGLLAHPSVRPVVRQRQLAYHPPASSAVLVGTKTHPIFGCSVPVYANAFLVDASRGLYATSAHVVEGAEAMFVVSPEYVYQVRFPSGWRHDLADLALVQVVGPHTLDGMRSYRIAVGPPRVGEMLSVIGYETSFHANGFPSFEGSRTTFRTERATDDGCVDTQTCAQRDEFVEKLLMGEPLSIGQRRFIYPRFIYATYAGTGQRGIIPGMSGSPTFDGSGSVVGVVSAYYTLDPFGRHGRLSPAYLLHDLLAKARADIEAESSR